MSDVLIRPASLRGRLKVPLSKSAAHRAVICSALSGGGNIIPPDESISDDIKATKDAVSLLLAANGKSAENIILDCGESGSTLRFLIPLAAALGVPAKFIGRGRLPQRPIGIYLDCLPKHGAVCETCGGLPLKISGKLTPGVFSLPGDISSQFITGLLLSLPLLDGESEIRLTSPLESAGYVDMTVQIMKKFGVSAQKLENGWIVPGNQKYLPNTSYIIERDWSQAAFFLAAGALGGKIELEGLNVGSCQGDRAAEKLFRKFGANIYWNSGVLTAEPQNLRGMDIDASQIPDLVPVLAATAAVCEGQTIIYNAKRLRLKESDRLSAMASGLNSLGGKVRETPDGLIINGVDKLHSGKIDGYNDHRVVMAFAVAALKADGDIIITDSQSVQKSYPDFFKDYNSLGGRACVMGK